MPSFDQYVMRHGEFWVQDIIERIERYEGVRHERLVSLEERWAALMYGASRQHTGGSSMCLRKAS